MFPSTHKASDCFTKASSPSQVCSVDYLQELNKFHSKSGSPPIGLASASPEELPGFVLQLKVQVIAFSVFFPNNSLCCTLQLMKTPSEYMPFWDLDLW